MRIAVNTRMLIRDKMEGIGYFTLEVAKRLTVSHPEHEFIFLFDRPFDQTFIETKNIIPVQVFPPARHPLLWYLWYEWALPAVFRKYKPDAFLSTDGYLPLRTNIPSLAVFHDINFEHYPKDLPLFNRIYYRHYFPLFARKANRIAAVSEFTKSDIVSTYRINPDKIDVVYNGVSEKFEPVTEEIKTRIRNKFSKGKPYFLFVGALHQRKNIANLLRAFEQFKSETSTTIQLLLAGQKRWWTEEMENVYQSMSFKEDVIFTGRLTEEDLLGVTASALALAYVSAFEGFGIPIIEAMRCGVPVLTSNVTSMPEIAGNAAHLCDPFSVASISEGLKKISSDESYRNSLIEKGLKRQQDFSWKKTADDIWKSIEKIL